jgi:hypothetical protein
MTSSQQVGIVVRTNLKMINAIGKIPAYGRGFKAGVLLVSGLLGAWRVGDWSDEEFRREIDAEPLDLSKIEIVPEG